MSDRFVYVTYVRATQQKLWDALLNPEFQRQYWFGMHQECDWKAGSEWRMLFPDGRVADEGEVLEFDPPRRAGASGGTARSSSAASCPSTSSC